MLPLQRGAGGSLHMAATEPAISWQPNLVRLLPLHKATGSDGGGEPSFFNVWFKQYNLQVNTLAPAVDYI